MIRTRDHGERSYAIPPSLDFLRRLRIKNAVETMHYSMLGVLRVIVSVGLVWLVAGCGEDPRYSAKTQYLGGVYGGAAGWSTA